MEIKLCKIGKILESYDKLGYFESDSLRAAIEKMKNDRETGIGFSVQLAHEDPEEEARMNDLLTEVWDSI